MCNNCYQHQKVASTVALGQLCLNYLHTRLSHILKYKLLYPKRAHQLSWKHNYIFVYYIVVSYGHASWLRSHMVSLSKIFFNISFQKYTDHQKASSRIKLFQVHNYQAYQILLFHQNNEKKLIKDCNRKTGSNINLF